MLKLILKIVLFVLLVPLVVLFGLFLTAPSGSEFIRKNPNITALIRQRNEEYQKTGKKVQIQWQWVQLNQISPNIIHAVILAEDVRFYQHNGFDVEAIKLALEKNMRRKKYAIGGSTITQQLAKNLYLSTKKSIPRKIRELITAFKMERRLSKKRILELYLNVIEFGNGIYGVEAASQYYFSKSAAELSIDEASRLVSIIPSPRRHSPYDGSKFTEHRRKWLLSWLYKTAYIDSVQYESLHGEKIENLQATIDSISSETPGAAGINQFLLEVDDSLNADLENPSGDSPLEVQDEAVDRLP